MAKTYFEKLSWLAEELGIEKETGVDLGIKHFFSGAALYANNSICASWSPAGLAFKLGEMAASKLIANGEATPLKYFDKGQVKKDYALFEDPEVEKSIAWKEHILNAIKHSEIERTP